MSTKKVTKTTFKTEETEACELFKMIPKDKLDYLFQHSTAGVELDKTFLCFEDAYKEAATKVPKDKIIIDLGCAYATQSWYFRSHKKYIGVDIRINNDSVIHTENSEFFCTSIQTFIKEALPTLQIGKEDMFAICSAVPDSEAVEMVRNHFKYFYVWYPFSEAEYNFFEKRER